MVPLQIPNPEIKYIVEGSSILGETAAAKSQTQLNPLLASTYQNARSETQNVLLKMIEQSPYLKNFKLMSSVKLSLTEDFGGLRTKHR